MFTPTKTRKICVSLVLVACLMLPGLSPAQRLVEDNDNFPVVGGKYKSQNTATFTGPDFQAEIVSMSLKADRKTQPVSISASGGGQFSPESFFDVFTELSVDGGDFQVDSFFDVFVEITIDIPPDQTTGNFQAEIVSMELVGELELPSGPVPMIIRESPGRPSPGLHTVTEITSAGGGGQYSVESFFDVFTELSVDGGQSWIPADGPVGVMLVPPLPPYVALDTAQQWNDALGRTVLPVARDEWTSYMNQWNQYSQEGPPYPENQFLAPDLYIWEDDCPGDDDPWPDEPGLVMAWGNEKMADGSYSSAWKYHYPEDPDLTNVTITITVRPPCGINAVSFGMRDINGNIRAWYWNVAAAAGPGTLACDVTTTISINTSLTGTAAATPASASYMNNPAFDITQVQDLIVDENNAWVGGAQPVPPPGQLIQRPWNYWYDLIITPNVSGKPDKPVKWSQPPKKIAPNVLLGWDEVSVRPWVPLMADDWLCKDQRPVTDVHWWGSFLNWLESEPPLLPAAFHIGIWTDVPKNADDFHSFSHPGKMVWQYICTDYQWNFVGYDKDPRAADNPDPVDPSTVVTAGTVDTTVVQPAVHDACFQFYCVLPQSAWFYQKPLDNGSGRVYWLSIAAIYDPDQGDPVHPWGWKTRPRFFNDDAVRIFSLIDGNWPPVVGSAWQSGKPVAFPDHISWDLAFELTTNKPEPVEPSPDLNFDRLVNWRDFAIMANKWLATVP